MICPVDKTQLVITDREGVEIDYCPTCRGVWLDRGEIDKIVSRAQKYDDHDRNFRREERYDDRDRRYYDDDDDHHRYDNRGSHHDGRHHHKKESFLGDLFDF